MATIYRTLLALYPAEFRRDFAEEMVGVHREAEAGRARGSRSMRFRFVLREAVGLLAGALREHARGLTDGFRFSLPTRRFRMRPGFRFPKTTAVLMMIILAGVVIAIDKGEAISIAHAEPGAFPGPHFNFLPAVALILACVYAVGLLAWAILFALRRSGVHRLADVSDQRN